MGPLSHPFIGLRIPEKVIIYLLVKWALEQQQSYRRLEMFLQEVYCTSATDLVALQGPSSNWYHDIKHAPKQCHWSDVMAS